MRCGIDPGLVPASVCASMVSEDSNAERMTGLTSFSAIALFMSRSLVLEDVEVQPVFLDAWRLCFLSPAAMALGGRVFLNLYPPSQIPDPARDPLMDCFHLDGLVTQVSPHHGGGAQQVVEVALGRDQARQVEAIGRHLERIATRGTNIA